MDHTVVDTVSTKEQHVPIINWQDLLSESKTPAYVFTPPYPPLSTPASWRLTPFPFFFHYVASHGVYGFLCARPGPAPGG